MRNGQGERNPIFFSSCQRGLVQIKNNLKKALKERNEAKFFEGKNIFCTLEKTNREHRKRIKIPAYFTQWLECQSMHGRVKG